MVADAVARAGTADQQADILPRLASGERLAAWCLAGTGSSAGAEAGSVTVGRGYDGYILDGLAELDARRGPMLEWFAGLEAPHKERIPFEAAAHAVAFEQADAVQELLTETIIPATYDGPG